jgi:hypothetical protein
MARAAVAHHRRRVVHFRGFAVAIRVMRTLISALTSGRPAVVWAESWVQYSRRHRRCHRRTVSGVTMRRECLHPAQILARPTQKACLSYDA